MARRLVTVFGGSGFIGRHLVKRLAQEDWVVRVAVRDPDAAAFLQPLGNLAQIVPVAADITRPASVAAAVEGAELVINLVGILFERGKSGFQAVHVDGAANVAKAAKAAGVSRLMHMSALGADKRSQSDYARTKALGEDTVRAAFPEATIFRPSVIFGPEDDFFNRFASLAANAPFLPVITRDGLKLKNEGGRLRFDCFGSGGTKFQPVYVGDVAEAFMKAAADEATKGQTYELGGPRVYTMKEVMELVMAQTGRQRRLLPLTFGLAGLQAAILQFLPKPMLTPDQLRQLRNDNVLTGGQPGLKDLGINPTAAEVILPLYLDRFREPADRTLTRLRMK
ncbi:complex I NDUFA9 subunit family protein [Telmatospirillum sp. J64-1]|uniref:complex I NDUFA9 subunit family protein n=1 Tax=Telmatospirillum sp. J64-1 TaxID=2502183 RepID=UPI00115C7339|nr:complex I NDUFA9 subunit family protein [Telmatospirillum sp. J64-1]